MLTNSVIQFLNTYGLFALPLVVGGVALWHREHALFAQLMTTLVLTIAVTYVMKYGFDQPRPYVVYATEPLAGLAGGPSFPSGHAAIAFAVASVMSFYHFVVGSLFFILAGVVAFGRVAAFAHFPIDVAVGAFVGVFVAYVVRRLFMRYGPLTAH